ncbi:MAG TPA: site-2 protease family protein, partial [Candidatus Hydrogenedentes bacterium]|nr:site-2 protease family protein [Candidatus Hydrogenedentota bacterium]
RKPVPLNRLVVPMVLGDEEHPRFGVAPFQTALVEETLPDMPGRAAGLESGDVIVRANGKLVDRTTFVEMVEETPEGEAIQLDVRRGDESLSFALRPQTIGRLRGVAYGVLGGEAGAREQAPAEILAVEDAYREKSGLQRRDVIVAINGEPATAADLDAAIRSHPGAELRMTVRRPAILLGVLQQAEEAELTLPVDSVRAIGVELGQRLMRHYVPWARVVPEAFRQSYEALALVMRTLEALAARTVSPKNLGGPLMIASATTQAAEQGLSWLIRITAFISINLCVFNLLPLPILDGGLLVIHGIEGVRRKPLSPRLIERFQMVGLFFIIFLMVFVTYHDIRRWVESLIP